MKKNCHVVVGTLLAGAIGAYAAAAQADVVRREYHQNAAANCQGALPAFAGTLRSRPLGVGNEGSAAAFVTCSFSGDAGQGIMPTLRLDIFFTNNAASPITINCTGVFGAQRIGGVMFATKSIVVSPGANSGIQWTAENSGVADLSSPANVSCSLPPGAVMLDTFNHINVEIGA